MLVEAHEVRDLLDVVDDVVHLGRERVDVLAVDRRDEGRVEPLDDVVGDPVALLLGLEDVAREAAARRASCSSSRASSFAVRSGVLARLGEEVEEDAVLGNE